MNRHVIRGAITSVLLCGGAFAGPTETSIRPAPRPVDTETAVAPVVTAEAPHTSVRPAVRPGTIATKSAPPSADNPGFDDWIRGFRSRALNAGISNAVFDRAFAHARFDPEVIRRDANQSEFTKSIWDYLDSAASDTRIANGRAALQQNASVLNRIEATYGVDKEVVVAIWGLESAYGTFRGSMNIVNSLATLAYDSRRGAFFEEQLIAALKILQNGDTAPETMTGSWAGAMGHTQFIPTSYEALAVDFDGDGRRDIWSDDPTDALASTAAYLARYGWVKGMPWGVEVRLPAAFDYAQAKRDNLHMPSDWARRGVLGMDGAPVPDYGSASVLLPAGAKGAAFLIFKNFSVIERYNTADAYVIGVGHLSDRLRGRGPIRADWPREDRALSFDERQEMQHRLTARGFDTKGVDGRVGPLTIEAVRRFQHSVGMPPDGYASLRVLSQLR
ncbi:lytic murein transglycosylase [Puniceibacterium sediminis]|uniref:Membrane-bound lytic murein transglycosylase B n=1 Tax=Puniceibacterium sediminis TaxID=1608407 RepID=A0A238VG18_9RHOB|nr:lytic murein transglycosylase [Puniceibacterium sediminis]SNR33027.1 membrane-bound lytic murein transglycosylase B [Puniceibacterium sediminis]